MSDKSIQVIDRALDILEALSVAREGMGVTELGNALGLHKSTVHRILSAMGERGYVEKMPDKSVYRIGLKLVEISSVYLNSIELKTEARPYLWELTSRLNQTTHLAILDKMDAVYIDKMDVLSSIRLYSQIGRRIPVHCSALGKCLLSGMTHAELEEYFDGYQFEKFTDSTIINKDVLMGQIIQTAQTGWALDDAEHESGVRCIGAPVFDYRGKVIAAISVSGAADAISPERDGEIAKIVRNMALSISKRLGYRG